MADSFKTLHEHILEYKLKDSASKPAEALQKKMQDFIKAPAMSPGQMMANVLRSRMSPSITRATAELPPPLPNQPPDISAQLSRDDKRMSKAWGIPVYLTTMAPQFRNMLAKMLIPSAKSSSTPAGRGSISEEDMRETRRSNILIRGFHSVVDNLRKSMMSWWGQIKGYTLGPVFEMLYQTLMPLLNPVQDFLLTIVKNVLYPIVTRIGPKLQDIFLNLGRRVMPSVEQAGVAMGDWLSKLLTRFEEWTKSKDFDKWMDSTMLFFNELYKFVKDDLYPFVKSVLVPLIKSLYKDFKPFAQLALEHPKTTLAIGAGAYATAKYDLVGKLFTAIGFASLSRELVALRMALLGTAGATTGTTAAVGLLTKSWQIVAILVAGLVGYGIGKLLDSFLGVSERISEWYLFMTEMQSRLTLWLYDTIVAPLLEWLKPVGDLLQSVGVRLWENLITPVMNFGAKAGEWLGLDKLMLKLIEFWDKFKEYFSFVFNFIQRPFTTLRGWERMVEDISSTSGKALREKRHPQEAVLLKGGATIIPQAQEGGYVEQTGLALVHGGETIVPSAVAGSASREVVAQLTKSNDFLYYGFTHTIQRLDSLVSQRGNTVIDQVLVLGV